MQLNRQELEFTLKAVDSVASTTLDMAALKGSLLIKFATELHTKLQPAKENADLKEKKPELKEVKK